MKKLAFILLFAVYTISNAQYTKLLDFNNNNGSYPQGDLYFDGTFLYGMASEGGTSGYGVLFKILPDGTGYTKLMDFVGIPNGSNPFGNVISDGTFLYGTTVNGGTNNFGTIFKIMPDGSGYVKLHEFAGLTDGDEPFESLIIVNNELYGMTNKGGAYNLGALFKMQLDGTGFTKQLDFNGTLNGSYPQGSLISDGTFLYGMTSRGGLNDKGTIFKVETNGSGFSKLIDFNGALNGSLPFGSLIYDGSFLYGMTLTGGANNWGTLFKVTTNGTGFSKLIEFNGFANGGYPSGNLISDGTFIYGMTTLGGANNLGTIFQILPSGTGYLKLMDFNESISSGNPFGSLIYDEGVLYGMTSGDATVDLGTIFKFSLTPTILTEQNSTHQISIYPNPANDKVNINTFNNFSKKTLEVYTKLGQLIFVKEYVDSQIEINLAEWNSGIYFFRISSNSISKNGIITKN
jgi:uncharacterized repeat protein (TIGR03803 family)